MEYNSKECLQKSSEAFLCMKQQIIDFSQKQLTNVRSFINAIDHHIANQRSKQMFQPFCFLQESSLAFSDLQAYFTRLMVNMTQIPCLVDIAKSIQYFITESIKLYTFTNQCWFARVRQLQTTLKHFHRSQPPMEVCLKCSQNIRHQQIKQARLNMFNLIDDPYLFYQKQVTNKNSMYQETGQKSLQDKLSQLASGVQFGQICMRQLIQNLTTQGKELFMSKEYTQKQGDLQFIPILKSLAKHVKAERKETQPIGVQTNHSQYGSENTILSGNAGQGQMRQSGQKSYPKLALELSDKIKQIKTLQEKLQQQVKLINQYKNQINVLKEDQSVLQKRNSALEIQLNWSKSKQRQPKNKKGSQLRNNSRNNSQMPLNLEAIRQTSGMQDSRFNKLATEAKIDNKLNKSEVSSGVMKRSINLTSMNNPYSQTPQRGFRKTDNPFNYDKASTQSLQKKQQKQQQDASDAFHGEFPRLISTNINASSKQNYDFSSLNSSVLDIGRQTQQNRLKVNKFIKSQSPFSSMKRKNRRIGTVYDKQLLLKMLHQNEVKNNRSSMDYQNFKFTYETLIEKLIKRDQESIKENAFSTQKIKPSSKHKKLTRHLQKKSTISIKTFLRNQLISRDQNQRKGQVENTQKASKSQINQKVQTTLIVEAPKEILTNQQRRIINQLKNVLCQVESSPIKEHKRIVLNKKEHNVITEIMAYLVQLKVQNKLVYEEVRRMIASFDKYSRSPSDKQDKQAVQFSITQIINNHRACPRMHTNNFCSHLKHLVTSITKLTE